MMKGFARARLLLAMVGAGMLIGCGDGGQGSSGTSVGIAAATPTPAPIDLRPITGVTQTIIAQFRSPWAMTFLPNGLLLVTDNETRTLSVVTQGGTVLTVAGLPALNGIYDIALSPNYATDGTVYFTFAEPSAPGTPRLGPYANDYTRLTGVLAVASAQLQFTSSGPQLANEKVIWRSSPDVVSGAEWGGRIAFSPDKKYLFVTAGDRSVYFPAKALDNTLGKIVRLNLDGSIPADNPFVGTAGARTEIWTAGHRNPYGLAFAPDGRLWSSEHGPKGGDEFNLIKPGLNYGWPDVSSGDGYDGTPIPKPAAGDGFATSAYVWTPAIAPAGLIFYSGTEFADWRGDALLTGLVSQALIRVHIDGDTAKEVQRIDLGGRAREIEQGPDGSLWALIDSPNGKLIRLMPVH